MLPLQRIRSVGMLPAVLAGNPMPSLSQIISIAAVVTTLAGTAAAARADTVSGIRLEMAAAKATIDRLDAALVEAERPGAELRDRTAAYTAKVAEINALGRALRDRGEQLTARKEQIIAEHQAATQLCGQKVPDQEYKAKAAQCEQAIAAYRRDADELQREHEQLAAEYSEYEAAHKRLGAEKTELRQSAEAQQSRAGSLHADREKAVRRFNQLREQLIAAQAKAN